MLTHQINYMHFSDKYHDLLVCKCVRDFGITAFSSYPAANVLDAFCEAVWLVSLELEAGSLAPYLHPNLGSTVVVASQLFWEPSEVPALLENLPILNVCLERQCSDHFTKS